VKNTNFKNIKKTLKKGLYKKNTIYISRINNHRPGGLYQFNKLFKMKNTKKITGTWVSATGRTEYEIGRAHIQSSESDLTDYYWLASNDNHEVGGELQIWKDSNGVKWVNDFDGAFDLPKGIKTHLMNKGIEVDF